VQRGAREVAWTQWGGPSRNFQTEASGLRDTWPAGGPRVVWKRPLGEGYSSPAVESGVLYTSYGKPRQEIVLAANAETGATLWEHATPMEFQSDAGADTFQQADGKVVWSKNDFGNVYSSPVLISVGGLEQLAAVMDGAVIAVNPHNGDLQWQVPFTADYSIAVASPVWGPDNLLFVSAEYNAGAKVIELQRSGQQTKATELWSSNRLRRHHGNAMRIGDAIYLSSGGKGSQAILSAVDARTGKIYWQERSIEKATFVWADQKLITLDQDGNLMIAHPSPESFRIAAKAKLLEHLSWTPPTLVGSRVYIRDRRNMMAVDLS
jgi:outer membrane protein assembly factor BamB